MIRKILLALSFLLLVMAAWLWWNQPQRVEMASYAPADALVYVEANDLPELARALAATDAWRTLAPLAGADERLIALGDGTFNRYTLGAKWLAWTGLGTAEAVVLSRAQVAAIVSDFDATEEDAGTSLNIKPRVALIIESHTSESRLRAAIEKIAGDMARRVYGDVSFTETKTNNKDATPLLMWTATNAANTKNQTNTRRIIVTVNETVAIIGNDEATVREVLAVRRGERPSLANDKNLEMMRERVNTIDSLAFAYVSPKGAAKLLQLAALAYAGRAVSDARTQSFVATLVPQLAGKFVTGGAWSSHALNGAIEDRYFIAMPDGVGARLRQSLAGDTPTTTGITDLLPVTTHQVTFYNARNPEAAWRGLQNAVMSQLDLMTEAIVGKLQLFDALLKPYGIDSPRDFLRATGSPIATARLDATSATPLLIVNVRDREALQNQVRKRLGANAHTERVGDTEMLVARNDNEQEAASFVGENLIYGTADDVRRCLQARAQGNTLARAESFRKASSEEIEKSASTNIITLTDGRDAAAELVSLFGKRMVILQRIEGESTRKDAFNSHTYSISETQITDDGIERRTHSYFGLFGTLATQFAPHRETR